MHALARFHALRAKRGSALSWTFAISDPYPSGYTGADGVQRAGSGGLADGVVTGSSSVAATNGVVSVRQWIRADFGSIVPVSAAKIAAIPTFDGWDETYVNGADLQYSDDASSWTTATVISGISGGATSQFTLGVSCRYVRIYGTTSNFVGIGEFWFI